MADKERISAVMFVYNEEKFIQEMIDSIGRQTKPVDEIIIVDDFSTDGTKEIISKNSRVNPKIKYVLNEKKGKVNAYQKGLSLVTSDFFFICAGDDVLTDTYVEELYTYLNTKSLNFVLSNYYIADSSLKVLSVPEKKEYYSCEELLKINYGSGYLFGRSLIIDHLIPMPERLVFEDWYNNIVLSSVFNKVAVYTKPLFYYRRHQNASTTNLANSKNKFLHHLERDIKLFELVLEKKILKEPKLINIAHSRLRYYKLMLNFSLKNYFPIIFDSNLSIAEKIKCSFFPIYFNIKYK